MDPLMKAKKIEAMRSYKKRRFVYKLTLHALAALICSLLCSSLYGVPSIGSSTTTSPHLFIISSIPYIWSFLLNPKCLFLVVNVIVVYLVGESKLGGSKTTSSPADQIYDEYVERRRKLRGVSQSLGERKEEKKVMETSGLVHGRPPPPPPPPHPPPPPPCEQPKDLFFESAKDVDVIKEVKTEEDLTEVEGNVVEEVGEEKEANKEGEEKEANKEGEEEEEEHGGLPTEELNRRIDDFIARVNRQRWLESRSLVCGKA